jgi:hypothetical protein
MEWREECLGAVHPTQNPSLPLRTTAGICVVDRALYMFGGSQGSPDNSDIYQYDLGTFLPPAHAVFHHNTRTSNAARQNAILTLWSLGPYVDRRRSA